MKKYYYQKDGQSLGPYTLSEIAEKNLAKGTYIWYEGLDSWIPIEKSHFSNYYTNTSFWVVWGITLAVIVGAVLFGLLFLADMELSALKSEIEIKNKISSMAYDDPSVDFQMYLEKFYRDIEYYECSVQKPANTIIMFAELDKIRETSNVAGISFGYNNDNSIEIYINPRVWFTADKAKKYWIMYHELAHDILNIDHVKKTPDNVGKLMYPDAPEDYSMDDFIEAYHEAFSEFALQHCD